MRKVGVAMLLNRCGAVVGLSLGATWLLPSLLWAQATPSAAPSGGAVTAAPAQSAPQPQPVTPIAAPPTVPAPASTEPAAVPLAAEPVAIEPAAVEAAPAPVSVSPPGPSAVQEVPQQVSASVSGQAEPSSQGVASTPSAGGYSGYPTFPPPGTPALTPGWSWVDTVASESPALAVPKRNPFRGSRFDWTHNVTTSTLGVGQDYLSSSYQGYQQGFSLLLAYFPYDGETFRVRLAMAPGLDVALTNSDVTTTQREPLLRDLPLVVGGSVILAMDAEHLMSSILAPNLAFFLPTSKASWNSGDYLTVSPRVSLSQQLPLFGAGAAAFDDVDLWLQLRYDRLFARGATAIDDDLNRPTMGSDGRPTQSDVLDGSQNAPNAFRVDLSVGFSEELFGHPLTITINADYRVAQLYGIAPYAIETDTGPVTVEPDPSARTWRQGAGYGADATYQSDANHECGRGVHGMWQRSCPARGADLGNSSYKTPFYTPHAIFWGGLVLHVDTVLDQLINGDKTNSSVLRRDLATTSLIPRF